MSQISATFTTLWIYIAWSSSISFVIHRQIGIHLLLSFPLSAELISFVLKERLREVELVSEGLMISIIELLLLHGRWRLVRFEIGSRPFDLIALFELLPDLFYLLNSQLVLSLKSFCDITRILHFLQLAVDELKLGSVLTIGQVGWQFRPWVLWSL